MTEITLDGKAVEEVRFVTFDGTSLDKRSGQISQVEYITIVFVFPDGKKEILGPFKMVI
jgi:hypothetical protein